MGAGAGKGGGRVLPRDGRKKKYQERTSELSDSNRMKLISICQPPLPLHHLPPPPTPSPSSPYYSHHHPSPPNPQQHTQPPVPHQDLLQQRRWRWRWRWRAGRPSLAQRLVAFAAKRDRGSNGNCTMLSTATWSLPFSAPCSSCRYIQETGRRRLGLQPESSFPAHRKEWSRKEGMALDGGRGSV